MIFKIILTVNEQGMSVMIHFVMGEAGTGKSVFLKNKIQEMSRLGKKIFVIIPEQFSFEYERKMYLELGMDVFNSIEVYSFSRLARSIFDAYGSSSGEYADDNRKIIFMYKAIEEAVNQKSLVFFNSQSKNRSFITDALALASQLRRASVTPDVLASKLLSADERIRDKAYDILTIYTAYDRIMKECGFKDSLTDITEAAAEANIHDHFAGAAVFVDEFDSFSPDEREMLDVCISQSDEMYISLCMPEPDKNEFSLFATINGTYRKIIACASKYDIKYDEIKLTDSHRFKNEAVKNLSRSIFRKKAMTCSSDKYVSITSAKDLYEEIDFVSASIRHLVSEKGYRFRDISIVSRVPEDYDIILDSAMARYDIPYFTDSERSVMHTAIVLLVTSLLDIISSKKPDTEMIFRYLKTFLTPCSLEEISFLENYTFKWNIKGLLWNEPFTYHTKYDEEEAAQAEEIRTKCYVPVFELKKKCEGKSAAELCRIIYCFLDENIIPKLQLTISEYKRAGLLSDASEMTRIFNCITEIFDVMTELFDDEILEISTFKEVFVLILKQNKFLNPPQKLDCVSVVSAEKARLENPKAVFIIGANDGILPFAVKQTGLLNDSEKDAFADMGIDLAKNTGRQLCDERFTVYRLLSFASERVYLTYPLSDTGGGVRYPSYLISQIESLYDDRITSSAGSCDILFYSPVPKAAYYNYVQSGFDSSEKGVSIKEALMTYPEFENKLKYLENTDPDADHFIRNTGLVKELMTERLNISATSFESFSKCRFQYFCRYGLKLKGRETNETAFSDIGNIVHACLERLIGQCRSKEDFLKITEYDVIKCVDEYAYSYIEENLGGSKLSDSRNDARFRRISNDMVTLIEHLKEELSQSSFMPVGFEITINERNGFKPVTLTTDDGIEIVLNGKIDRADIFEKNGEKFIRIIDYKTGNKTFSLENVFFGIDMQMLLYLFAISGDEGPYGSTIPAGILYMPSGCVSLANSRDENRDISKYLQSFYHMSGVVLKEFDVLNAMEENIEGVYIPARMKKDGNKNGELLLDKTKSHCLSREQFARLKKHSDDLMRKMADELYGGNISASPLVYGKDEVCTYCEFSEICGNSPRRRERIPDDTERLKAEILGEESEM